MEAGRSSHTLKQLPRQGRRIRAPPTGSGIDSFEITEVVTETAEEPVRNGERQARLRGATSSLSSKLQERLCAARSSPGPRRLYNDALAVRCSAGSNGRPLAAGDPGGGLRHEALANRFATEDGRPVRSSRDGNTVIPRRRRSAVLSRDRAGGGSDAPASSPSRGHGRRLPNIARGPLLRPPARSLGIGASRSHSPSPLHTSVSDSWSIGQ